jgi:hypothetical protein
MAAQLFVPVPRDNDKPVGPAYQYRFPVGVKQFYGCIGFIRSPAPFTSIGFFYPFFTSFLMRSP